MSAFIVQDGKYVTQVEVDSGIQYFANSIISPNTEFLVTDLAGDEVLRQYVSVGWFTGNAWLGDGTDESDVRAPSRTGHYRFYPDSADLYTYLDFQVVPSGSGSDGGSNGESILGNKWVKVGIYAGVGVGALFILAAILSASSRRK